MADADLPPQTSTTGIKDQLRSISEKPIEDFQDIKALAEQGREALQTNGLSRSLSHALKRGETMAERKSAWMFDFYQATGFFPVDYRYYSRPYRTQCGNTELISIHPTAYTAEGEDFPADQVFHKDVMREAHKAAVLQYENLESDAAVMQGISMRPDKWANLLKYAAQKE